MTTIWEDMKARLKGALPPKGFSLWIDCIHLLEKKDDAIVLGCPNKFSLKWIQENYLGLIEEGLRETGNGHCRLIFKVKAQRQADPPPAGILNDSKQMVLPNVSGGYRKGLRTLNNGYTFERFVVGKCNEFAYSASRALAQEATLSYDCLFILANTGLGKSHLAQAAGHAILQNNPEKRVFYITAEDFVNEMIFALRNGRIDEFKSKYRRSCDVLLLEEVQFLSGKEKTQMELGYTLDALANDHKRIVFTSSMFPKDIPNLTKEISSRLTSGLITTLTNPDYETRVKILERKSLERGMILTEEIICHLARHLTGDIRQMESALQCLKAMSELMKARIDLGLAKEVIRCHVSTQSSISLEDIRDIVCQYFKLDSEILSSNSRRKTHAYPRNVYIYLCRNLTDKTAEDIGNSINRTHSTVLYASEVIEQKLRLDKKAKMQVDFLRQRLKDKLH